MKTIQFNTADLFGIYILAYFTCRFAEFIPIFSILLVILFAISIVLLKTNNEIFMKSLMNRSFVFLILYIIITALIYYLFVNNDRYWNVIDNSIKIATICVFCAFFDTLEPKKQKFYLNFAIVGIFITTITTFINEMVNPGILRATASRSAGAEAILGMGGYDFIYGLVIVNILITSFLLQKAIKKNRLFYIVFLIVSSITILISGYTTATILNLCFIGVIFFWSSKGKRVVGVCIGFFCALFPEVIGNILLAVADFKFTAAIISERFKDIAGIFLGTNSSADVYGMEERTVRIEYSFEAFKKHPFLGNFVMEQTWLFGEHTEWIDRLAQFGIFITSLIIMFWILRFLKSREKLKRSDISLTSVNFAFLYFLILGFLNPASYMFTVFPLLFLVPNMHILFGGVNESINN